MWKIVKTWNFEPDIEYQREAIYAVLNIFEGQDQISQDNLKRYYKNELSISKSKMAENLMRVQKNPVNHVGYWDDELLQIYHRNGNRNRKDICVFEDHFRIVCEIWIFKIFIGCPINSY